MTRGKVLVTGASGYIAGFVVKDLIDAGWDVVGTVRSLGKADAVRTALGLTAEQLPLVAADLTGDAGWADAAAGCDYVQHIASPLPVGTPKNDDELIVPARDGALRVLAAAKAAGVKRVVMTSSVAAIAYGKPMPPGGFTEVDWTDPASLDAYAYVKSKTIAERTARDWVAANGAPMELVTINPGLVLGPVHGSDFSGSLAVVTQLMNGAMPGVPRIGFPVVDVRDVAALHVTAMTAPGMAGERFIAAGKFLWMGEVAEILKSRLGDRAKRVPTLRLPNFVVRLSALFDPVIRTVVSELGRTRACNAAHAKAVLGWTTRPAEESIVDTARSLIAAGLVKQ